VSSAFAQQIHHPLAVLTDCLNLYAVLTVQGLSWHMHDSVLQPDWSRQISGARIQQFVPPILPGSFPPHTGKGNEPWVRG